MGPPLMHPKVWPMKVVEVSFTNTMLPSIRSCSDDYVVLHAPFAADLPGTSAFRVELAGQFSRMAVWRAC